MYLYVCMCMRVCMCVCVRESGSVEGGMYLAGVLRQGLLKQETATILPFHQLVSPRTDSRMTSIKGIKINSQGHSANKSITMNRELAIGLVSAGRRWGKEWGGRGCVMNIMSKHVLFGCYKQPP